MISIIIPTLNEEKYINKLLSSLKNQFYKNFEVIVVDAGSTDETEKVVNKFKHRFKRLDFVMLGEKNVSKQRNIGARVSVGEILVFLDADIIVYDQHFLSNIVKIFRYKKKCGGIMTYVYVDPKEEILIDKIFHTINNSWLSILNTIGFPIMRGGSMVVKKEYFDKIKGFNENMYVAEDIDFSKRLRSAAKVRNSRLIVSESARRYRRDGYIKLWWQWTVNGIWCFLFGKSYLKKWNPVR
ncbi:MAG: glycosyltransferase [Candidatus Woesearchaeota archaeon]